MSKEKSVLCKLVLHNGAYFIETPNGETIIRTKIKIIQNPNQRGMATAIVHIPVTLEETK